MITRGLESSHGVERAFGRSDKRYSRLRFTRGSRCEDESHSRTFETVPTYPSRPEAKPTFTHLEDVFSLRGDSSLMYPDKESSVA